jgi:hypothetical protein
MRCDRLKIKESIISARNIAIVLFLVPTIAMLIKVDFTILNLAYFFATELILIHSLYVGYLVLNEHAKVSYILTGLATGIWLILLILFSRGINDPVKWFAALMLVLVLGVLFQTYSSEIAKKKYVKEFCKYKVRTEMWSIILAWGALLLTKYFQEGIVIGIGNILVILAINYLIFRHGAYKKLEENSPIKKIKSRVVKVFKGIMA